MSRRRGNWNDEAMTLGCVFGAMIFLHVILALANASHWQNKNNAEWAADDSNASYEVKMDRIHREMCDNAHERFWFEFPPYPICTPTP